MDKIENSLNFEDKIQTKQNKQMTIGEELK